MRQAGEIAQLLEHRRERQSQRVAERQCREGIGGIVAAGDLERGHGHQGCAAARQPRLLIRCRFHQREIRGAAHAETDHALSGARHAHHFRLVGVDHGGLAVGEDARLRIGVVAQRGVAVHVVRRHVEHHGCLELQGMRGVELE
jgi:hypothetical protein